jgi:hypothetical protein
MTKNLGDYLMANEVTALLAELRDGSMSIEEVAERFRNRSWPRRNDSQPATYAGLASKAQEDPDPYIPGSFDDVAAAFHRGDLTSGQYEIFAQAMAESMRAEDRLKDEGASGSQ